MMTTPSPSAPKVARPGQLNLVISVVGVALRALVWSLTGSVAVLAWLLEGVLSLVAAPVARLVLGPGHARQIEEVALIRSGLALGAAAVVGALAALRIVYPWPVGAGSVALIVLALAIGAAAVQAWRGRIADTGSVGWLGELGPVLLVLIGLGSATGLGALGLDAISGLVLAVAIGWTAVEDARRGLAATPSSPQ